MYFVFLNIVQQSIFHASFSKSSFYEPHLNSGILSKSRWTTVPTYMMTSFTDRAHLSLSIAASMMLGVDASSNILVDHIMDAWEEASMATRYSCNDLYLSISPILRCDEEDVEIRHEYCE